jgi:SPP1 gp7 family putative phage head morphogenesis protein
MKTKDYVTELLDWEEADDAMKAAISPYLLQVLIETGKDAMQAIGMDPSLYDPFAPAIREFLAERTVKIAKDINDETEKQLRASISQGINEGESSHQIRARIEVIMGIASTMRADLIAVTEVARAQSAADIAAWDQSGLVHGKEWYTALDERRCLFCKDLHGRVIPLEDNYFDKGDIQVVEGKNRKGEATRQTFHHNYDDVPGCPAHPRCRCTLLPIRLK